jgi:hypothetical protein
MKKLLVKNITRLMCLEVASSVSLYRFFVKLHIFTPRLSPSPLGKQGCFIRNGMYFVNIIGDKYQVISHELVTILMPKIEC